MSLLIEITRTLTASIMSNFIWNFVGAIIWGQVSLAEDYPQLLQFTAANHNLVTRGKYGLEGSN